ncbi:MAG: helix-turn-helix transcriptional regulator [Dehalococcoidia bacterium]
MTHLGTDVNTPEELVSVDDAVREYGISRSTIFRLFKTGLSKYRRPGDRKTYVSRRQLEDMTAFRKVD